MGRSAVEPLSGAPVHWRRMGKHGTCQMRGALAQTQLATGPAHGLCGMLYRPWDRSWGSPKRDQ